MTARPVAFAPGERIQAHAWSFIMLAVMAGLGAGFLLHHGTARKALRALIWR